ncbi:MAG: DUF4153 domain-containing protein, partial [bacterium]
MHSQTQAAARAGTEAANRTLDPTVASAALSLALLLGIAGDSLLADGPVGIGFSMWIALVAVALVSVAWRADLAVTREPAAWLACAVAFAAAVAWRDAEELQLLNFFTAIGSLMLAAASLNRAGSVLFAQRLGESLRHFASAVRGTVTGFVPLAFREAPTLSAAARLRSKFARVARAAALALVLVLVFGALLRSADPIFASLVRLPDMDVGTLIGHLILITILTVIVSGWTRTALVAKESGHAPTLLGAFQLDTMEITAALGALNLLFAAFVIAQLGWFFGGEQFLHERTGLTAAQYARQGFFQMVTVVALVVPVLLGTRAALVPGRALAKRHTLLALPIVGLLGAMIVSAALRMRLYVEYFGLSTDRLYPLAFMGWLAV